jgi:hypothetical protein
MRERTANDGQVQSAGRGDVVHVATGAEDKGWVFTPLNRRAYE